MGGVTVKCWPFPFWIFWMPVWFMRVLVSGTQMSQLNLLPNSYSRWLNLLNRCDGKCFLPFVNQVRLWLITDDAGADLFSLRVFTLLPLEPASTLAKCFPIRKMISEIHRLGVFFFHSSWPRLRLLHQLLDRPSSSHQWASSLCHPWPPSHRRQWSHPWPPSPLLWSRMPPTPQPCVWTSVRIMVSPHLAPAGGPSLPSFPNNKQWGIMAAINRRAPILVLAIGTDIGNLFFTDTCKVSAVTTTLILYYQMFSNIRYFSTSVLQKCSFKTGILT